MVFNLLHPQNATGTDTSADTSRWSATNATLASTTAQAKSGTRSLQATASAAANVTLATSSNLASDYEPIPILPSTQYTAVASCRAHASAVGGKDIGLAIYWMTAAGTWCTPQSNEGTYGTANSSGWTQVSVTATSPSDAVLAFIRPMNQTSVNIGDIWYWDELGIWEGTSTTWEAPTNLLSYNQSSGTDDLWNTTGWWSDGGSENTIASSTAEYRSGARSLSCTAVSTNTMYARSDEYESTGWACSPGDLINLSAWSKWGSGNTTTQSFYVVLDFYDSGGTFVSTASAQGQTIVSYSASWQQSTLVDYVVPAGVAKMGIRLASWGSITTGKVVHWDDIILTRTLGAGTPVTYSRRLIIG